MVVSVRNALLCLFTASAALFVPVAAVAASSRPGGPCSNSTVGAISQYCEDIPSATGAHEAGPGTPALAGHLPPSVLSRLQGAQGGASLRASGALQHRRQGRASTQTPASQRVRAQLLTLPAPGPRTLIAATSPARPSGWSLLSGLMVVLVAVTVALSAVALARRRRGGPS